MLSVIICSINPERATDVKRNFESTCGYPCEFIIIDNRELHWPIAKAYNEGAKQAKGEFLFFVHEDVRFLSTGWGPIITSKLAEHDCGAIGFAGSKIRLKIPSRLDIGPEYTVLNYVQGYGDMDFAHTQAFNFSLCRTTEVKEGDFTPVVVIDGMAMFVSKAKFSLYPFDESNLKGFHGYDIDFSQALWLNGLVNYVCTSQDVLFFHASPGAWTGDWAETIWTLYKDKWSKLPIQYTEHVDVNSLNLEKLSQITYYLFVDTVYKIKDLKNETFNEIIADYANRLNNRRLKWKYQLKRKLRQKN